MIPLGFLISVVLAVLQAVGVIHIGYLACALPFIIGTVLTALIIFGVVLLTVVLPFLLAVFFDR